MWFVSDIVQTLWDIGDFFWDAKEVVSDWVWPFNELYIPLWYIADGFYRLSLRFFDFDEWLDDAALKIESILTTEGVLGLIKWWFPWLYDIGEWFIDRFNWFWQRAGEWWDVTKLTVQGWIAIATEGLDALRVAWDTFRTITFPQWTTQLSLLASDWGNFVTQKLPTLFDISYAETWWKGKFLNVTKSINDAFTERENYWVGWSDWRDKVSEFFADPLEFLWNRFADWFLGPEE